MDILDISKDLAQELVIEWGMESFQVRVGINTGLVALGGYTEAEDTIMGAPVNLAARIESAAPPGGLLISHNTYRHVRGVFNVDPLEPITAKGFPELVPVYLVREAKPRAFRVQARGVEGVETRMVGRETELKYLHDALLTAIEEGEGQVVTISGEAGVGKSRLLYEFQNWIDLLPSTQAVFFFQGRGRQEAQGLPYSLLRDLFSFRFQILEGDTGQQARNKIESGFSDVFGKDDQGIMQSHILGQLLGFDFSASPHLKGVLNDAEQLRNRGLMYLVQYFQSLALELPVVIFLEDAHWGDDSSLDLVSRLGEYTLQHPWLIVCAARPTLFERRPFWGEGQDYHTLLELHPLSRRESRQLVTEILKLVEQVPNELRELVAGGAEGNPFYTEELIKMLIESGVVIPAEERWQIDLTRLEQVDVPSTLAGVLQARLDSLPQQERTVLQQASVVGRLFWDRIVAYIQAEGGDGGNPALIPHTLASLRNRELIYRHEETAFVGAVEYLFKHDVLREVTYESVLKRLRKTYHGLVADWLIANCGNRIGEYSGLIANHLLLAGRKTLAGEYFKLAGDFALASYANTEAENYFRHALNLSTNKSISAYLLAGLGKALSKTGQPEDAVHIWHKAIALYKELGDSDHLGEIYARLSWLLWYKGDWLKARDLCLEGLNLLAGMPDSPGYARLLGEAGRTALFGNEYGQVIPFCQRAIDMAKRVGDLELQVEAKITLAIYNDDQVECTNILKEVAKSAEANHLMRIAFRANTNIGVVLSRQFIDLNSAKMYTLQAAEIARYIGDVEGMLLVMTNLFEILLDSGELNTVQDQVVETLHSLTIPKTRVDKFLREKHPCLLFRCGDWFTALNAMRGLLNEMQDSDSLQRISDTKMQIAYIILEINHFGYHKDLSVAERFLLENIDDNLSTVYSNSGLVFVYIHQGRYKDAHDHFIKTKELLAPSTSFLFVNLLTPWIGFEFAIAERDWDEAINISESLVVTFQSGGYRFQFARWLINLGEALIGRGDPGDRERARETYQQSLDMFTEMGAPGYVKVLEERLGKIGD